MFKTDIKKETIWIILGILLIMEAALLLFLQKMDILPATYMVGYVASVLILDLGAAALLSGIVGPKGRIVGFGLSVLTALMLCVGGFLLYSTYSAMYMITADAAQYDTYYVVVQKDGKYNNINDLDGAKVWTIENNSKMQKEAMGKLVTKGNVEFGYEKDCFAVAGHLFGEKGERYDEAILISESRYDMVGEEIENFEEDTKIIQTIQIPIPSSDNASNIDVTQDSFNLYVSGSDARGDITEVARTDVNMIVSVNPKTKTILLTSIPRDAYIPLHMNGEMDKLTPTGIYGIEETTSTVEDWLGVNMDFYARVGFQMLVDLVDAVDGIDVYSDKKFKSSIAPFYYEVGWNHCNGKKALYFARERKAFGSKDSIRVENQQKVMKALIKKITGSKTLLMNYTSILNAVKASMQTDFSQANMSKMVKLQLADMSEWTVKRQKIEGTYASKGTWSMGPGRPLDVYVPKEDSVEKCVKKIQEVLYPVN